jgi:hypothetical protein
VSRILVLMLSFAFTSGSGNEVPGQLSSAPQCASPAPLYDGTRTSPPGIMVRLRSDVADPEAAISILAKKDGFTIAYRFPPRGYFVEAVTQRIIDALRCEPEVESVMFDALSSIT